MSDDQRSIYQEGAHDDSGVCSSCGDWFPTSEYGDDEFPTTCRECIREIDAQDEADRARAACGDYSRL